MQGGNGGNGGNGGPVTGGIAHGGGGGGGGIGLVLDAATSLTIANGVTVTGGGGGRGGDGQTADNDSVGLGGGGGAGGAGIVVTQPGATLNVNGSVTGGIGGAAGTSNADLQGLLPPRTGSGGVGIQGAGLTVNLNATVSGGLSGDGATRANALDLTGGSNTVTFGAGGSLTGGIGLNGAGTSLRIGQDTDVALTADNVISGAGSLVKVGAGRVTLYAASTYSGGTSIQSGEIVAWGGGRALGTGAIAMADGTTLRLGNSSTITNDIAVTGTAGIGAFASSTVTLSGKISGDALTIGQGGMPQRYSLTGQNTARGTLTVNTFTLFEGQGRWLGNIENNDSLSFLQSQTTIYAGVISGRGQTVTSVTGGLTLTGNNTSTGPLLVRRDVSLGDGGTSGSWAGDIYFLAPAVVRFNRSDDVTYASVISGDGGLEKRGAGRLTLSGANTYNGATTVSAGTLQVDGSIGASAITVASGATLTGAGAMKSAAIQSGGTLAAMGGAGGAVTTFSDRLDFAAGSTFQVTVSPDGTGTRAVAGQVAIAGGAVSVLSSAVNAEAWQASRTYRILDATGLQGVSGRFDSVTSNLAFLTPSLSYSPAAVDLTLKRNAVAYGQFATTPARRSAAGALDAFATQFGNSLIVRMNGLSEAQAPEALEQLSGAGLRGATASMPFRLSGLPLDVVRGELARFLPQGPGAQGPLAYGEDEPLTTAALKGLKPAPAPAQALVATPAGRIWASALGSVGRLRADAGAGEVASRNAATGLSAGIDTAVADGLRLGVALAGGTGRSQAPAALSSAEATFGQASLYGLATYGAGYVQGALAYGRQEIETRRSVSAFGAGDRANARFGADVYAGRLEAGWRVAAGSLGLTPFAAFAPALTRQEAHAETALTASGAPSPIGLSAPTTQLRSLPLTLGLKLDGAARWGDVDVTGLASLAWVRELQPTQSLAQSFTALPGSLFLLRSGAADRDLARGELQLQATPVGSSTSFFAQAQGDYGERTRAIRGTAGMMVRF